jgi:hypothetical protein
MKTRIYTPFLRNMKCPEVDGVYRHKESGNLMMLKNTWIKGFIDCEKSPEEPYDAYYSNIRREIDGDLGRTIIEPYVLYNDYDKVF